MLDQIGEGEGEGENGQTLDDLRREKLRKDYLAQTNAMLTQALERGVLESDLLGIHLFRSAVLNRDFAGAAVVAKLEGYKRK